MPQHFMLLDCKTLNHIFYEDIQETLTVRKLIPEESPQDCNKHNNTPRNSSKCNQFNNSNSKSSC